MYLFPKVKEIKDKINKWYLIKCKSCYTLKEIIDTAVFLIEYKFDFTVTEAITILINFLLIFVLLVASYLLSARIKNALVNHDNKAAELKK